MTQQILKREPVVPKVRLDRQPFSAADTVRRAINLFEVPQVHLHKLPAPSSRFRSAVDTYWARELRTKLIWTVSIYGSVDLGLSAMVGLPLALTAPAGFAITAGIFAMLQVGFLPLGIFYSRLHRAEKRNFNAFLLWLKGRYGVTLSAKQQLPKYLRKTDRDYETLTLVTSDGQELTLHSESGIYATKRGSYGELPKTLVGTEHKQQKPAAEMPEAAKRLFYQIGEHLAVLSARNMAPESAHVAERAQRDRDKVVALHADLVRLNALDAQQAEAIEQSFTTLLAELSAVVRTETKAALNALSVENTYIAGREERGGITLQKGASE